MQGHVARHAEVQKEDLNSQSRTLKTVIGSPRAAAELQKQSRYMYALFEIERGLGGVRPGFLGKDIHMGVVQIRAAGSCTLQ